MPTTPPPNEFGFKQITRKNWLSVDPAWNGVVMSVKLPNASDAWVHDLLETNLNPAVSIEVRRLFETARGALVYSLMFYPLLTIGTEQIFRTYEAAASEKCRSMAAPTKVRAFADKIKWLMENGAIASVDRPRWDAIRHLRNAASHPEDQSIFDPAIALSMLGRAVEMIDGLFV